MILNESKAFQLLMQAFKDNPDLDSASVLVKWGDEIRDYDANQVKAHQRTIKQFYTVMHGTLVQQSSDNSRPFHKYQPDTKYIVNRDDIGRFAKANGLRMSDLQALLDGRIAELNGYRTYWVMGTMSTEYKAPKDIRPDEKRGTFEKTDQQPYTTPMNVQPTEWK